MLLKLKTSRKQTELHSQRLAANNLKINAAVCPCMETTFSPVSKRAKINFLQGALHWRTMLCAHVKETQCVVAKALSRVTAIFSHA
jgi:hypothetical protein